MSFLIRTLTIALVTAGGIAQAAEPAACEWKSRDGVVLKYRWAEPVKPAGGASYPLVLFLHGSGERGADNRAQLRHGVTPILRGAEKLGQPIFLIAPQCPADDWWSPFDLQHTQLTAAAKPNRLLDAVIELVDHLMANHPIDRSRFYVTGLSMGGFGTWDLLGRIPGRIAAAVPVCGGGDPALAENFRQVPIQAFHGEKDSEVPVAATRRMIAALEQAGGKPLVTYFPTADHVIWPRVYGNREMLRWMFDQRRK